MQCFAYSRRPLLGATLLVAWLAVCVPGAAAPVAVSLDATADETSSFTTYWSDGIARLNLPYMATSNQPFWDIGTESTTYNGSFDYFPNDSAMQFGELTYDDAGLTGGTGVAPITGLTLGIEHNPLNPSYTNGTWLSFDTNVGSYSGTVTLDSGAVTSIDLTANYTTSANFGPYPLEGSGVFTISGDGFQVAASANFNTGGANPALDAYNPAGVWDWTGTILAVDALDGSVPEPSALVLLLGLGTCLALRRRRTGSGRK